MGKHGLMTTLFAGGLMAAIAAPPAQAAPGHDPGGRKSDDLKHPLGKRQAELRKQGLHKLLRGQGVAHGKNKVMQVASGQYVELARQGEDAIWTVTGQFGNVPSPIPFLASDSLAGPQHNQIPQPDRTVDNTTIWSPDFSKSYYETMLFSGAPGAISMRNFYLEQSSNRYTVNGTVEDWAQLPYNAAHYGRNWCGGIVCPTTTWWFIEDTLNAWYAGRVAAGMTAAQIDAYLAPYDVWDRYDADGDGNFNEPDGYIDHFQAVHAGDGEETGGGAYGGDALWSHRWYVQLTPFGGGGPHGFGGVQIGATSYWVGDYTIEPENGGVGVFAHEFGHDLGLPDLYDTSGNTGGAENSTAFWTLYSIGSYGSSGNPAEGIGGKPVPMSAYEKIVLGWSDYSILGHGQSASIKLGPASATTKQAQQIVLLLPDKQVTATIGSPYAGSYFYFSGAADNLDNSMTRTITLPAGAAWLAAKVNYDIEQDWDYAYLTVNGTPVATSLSTDSNPNGQNFGHGITGWSGGWIDLAADLSAHAGQTVSIGFRYSTDVSVVGGGLLVDDIAVTGSPRDDAESEPGWNYQGFNRTTGVASQAFFNAYLGEYRTYRGYDDALRTGPYNFGFLNNPLLGNWVEHYPYQDGLLLWYYDASFGDNNVGDHCLSGRCGGLVLPIDAHPALLRRPGSSIVWRPTVQSYDATFGLDATDQVCLHRNSVQACYGGLPGNPLFDDSQSYWVAPDPSIGHFGWSGVAVPDTGTTIRVVSTSAHRGFMQVQVNH